MIHMYVRPQLSRKRTSDRDILSREHNADFAAYRESLLVGIDYESDIEKTNKIVDEISQNRTLSYDEKRPILYQLNQLLNELQKKHSTEVENELADIEFSMRERIDEIETATREQDVEFHRIESTIWLTDGVDTDKLAAESMKLLQKY